MGDEADDFSQLKGYLDVTSGILGGGAWPPLAPEIRQWECLLDTSVLVSKCPVISDPSERCHRVSMPNCLEPEVSGHRLMQCSVSICSILQCLESNLMC